jgi:signal peptidase I
VADRPRHEPPIDDPAPEDPSLEEPFADDGDDQLRRFWRELPVLLVAAFIIAIVVKTFLVQAFYIPSISMSPTLQRGDRILVCRICTRIGGVDRGDVIVFSDPHPTPGADRGVIGGALHWLGQGIGIARPQNEDFVKRVVGLPGDVVEIHGGQLFVNGTPVEEPYLNPNDRDTSSFGPKRVPDGMLFVLGDNRAHSGDSRYQPPTGVGLVPQDAVIGKVFLVIYPPDRWGWVSTA